MARVSSSAKTSVSADKVWEVIGDPARIADWHPAVAESSTDGPGAGAERRCTLADGNKLVERIEAHDDAARSYTYTITAGALPVSNYRATLSVRDADGGSLIEWEGEFDPAGADTGAVEDMIRGIYESGLAALKQKLEG